MKLVIEHPLFPCKNLNPKILVTQVATVCHFWSQYGINRPRIESPTVDDPVRFPKHGTVGQRQNDHKTLAE